MVKFAHAEGFFKKNGLDVTLIYVNSGVFASQVVASGTAGAAAITATDALRVMSAGVPMKIIMVNIDQFQHLFVARPGIKNPGDMKGKKVAVSRYGSFSDIQTRFLIRQWGMEPDKDVQILQIGNSAARSAALASGRVDGAIVTPFFIPSAKKAGLNVIFDLSTINAKFANQIVIVNENLINEKRAAVRAFARGLIDAIKVGEQALQRQGLISGKTTSWRMPISRVSKRRVEGSSARSRLPIWRVFRRSGTIRLILRRAESQTLGGLLTGVLLRRF